MKKKNKSMIGVALIWFGLGIIIGGTIYPSVNNGTTYTILPGIILIYLSIYFTN